MLYVHRRAMAFLYVERCTRWLPNCVLMYLFIARTSTDARMTVCIFLRHPVAQCNKIQQRSFCVHACNKLHWFSAPPCKSGYACSWVSVSLCAVFGRSLSILYLLQWTMCQRYTSSQMLQRSVDMLFLTRLGFIRA